jgi:hypothetical protein
MKTFENIKTTVELKDISVLDSLQLNLCFPKNNEFIISTIKEMFDKHYNLTTNSDNVGIFKNNINLNNKVTFEAFIKFLTDLDNKYANRNILIEDFNKLLD